MNIDGADVTAQVVAVLDTQAINIEWDSTTGRGSVAAEQCKVIPHAPSLSVPLRCASQMPPAVNDVHRDAGGPSDGASPR